MYHKNILYANAKANGVVEELCNMDTKVLYISENTAIMNRWEVNKKLIY